MDGIRIFLDVSHEKSRLGPTKKKKKFFGARKIEHVLGCLEQVSKVKKGHFSPRYKFFNFSHRPPHPDLEKKKKNVIFFIFNIEYLFEYLTFLQD